MNSASGNLLVTEEPIGGYQPEINGFDIKNTYAPIAASIVLGGIKTFEGFPKGAEAPVFTYTLSEGDKVIDAKTTQGAGSYQFDSITYEETGTHVYTVKETKGTASGVIYDETEYDITVEVTDDGSGNLTTTATGADIKALNFNNTYREAPTPYQTPKTGDISYLLFHIILMALSGGGIVYMLLIDKNRKQRR